MKFNGSDYSIIFKRLNPLSDPPTMEQSSFLKERKRLPGRRQARRKNMRKNHHRVRRLFSAGVLSLALGCTGVLPIVTAIPIHAVEIPEGTQPTGTWGTAPYYLLDDGTLYFGAGKASGQKKFYLAAVLPALKVIRLSIPAKSLRFTSSLTIMKNWKTFPEWRTGIYPMYSRCMECSPIPRSKISTR